MKYIYCTIPLLALMLAGCGERGGLSDYGVKRINATAPGTVWTNRIQGVEFARLPDDAQLVVLGNREYTKRQLILDMTNTLFLVCSSVTNADEVAQAAANTRVWLSATLVSRFLSRAAFALGAEERGVVATDADRSNIVATVDAECRAARITRARYAEAFPGGEAALKIRMEEDARINAYFRAAFSNSLQVTSEEVDRTFADILDGNRESKLTNEIYKAEMAAFRRRLAEEHLEITGDEEKDAEILPPDYHSEAFEDYPATAFDDEELVPALLRVAAKNEWQSPIELERTIDLYMVTNVTPRSLRSPTLYTGFRVYREKDLGYVVPSKEEIRSTLYRMKNMAFVAPEAERLQRKFGLAFPYGFVWDQLLAKPKANTNQRMGLFK